MFTVHAELFLWTFLIDIKISGSFRMDMLEKVCILVAVIALNFSNFFFLFKFFIDISSHHYFYYSSRTASYRLGQCSITENLVHNFFMPCTLS